MIKRLAYILTLSMFLLACGGAEVTEEGYELIPRDQMADIIYDMNLVEAAFRGRLHTDTLAEEQMLDRMQFTLEKRSVSREQFLSSYQYYLKDPEDMSGIYNEAMARLSTHLSKVEESED